MARTVYIHKTENAAAILATKIWEPDLGINPNTANNRRFAPLNALDLQNFSTEDIEVRVNGSATRAFVVKAAQTFQIKPENGIWFYKIDIYNRDAVAQIEISEITLVGMKIKDVG